MARAAQSESFEVSSIRQNTSGEFRYSYNFEPGGGFIATNVPLRTLIALAFDIQPLVEQTRLTGSDDRTLAARFDIAAKPAVDTTGEPRAMLRRLLMDRFRMRTHVETRELPVFAMSLTRADRLGPQLRRTECRVSVPGALLGKTPADAGGPPPCAGSSTNRLGAVRMKSTGPLSRLIASAQQYLERPLVDATGLSGTFAWELSFASDARASQLPSIFTAFREQLGLRLDARPGPVEVIVIDSVAVPDPD